MTLFLCKRNDRWMDGWTYGDWEQWVCNRPGGLTQCARVVLALPGIALMLAVGPMNEDRDGRIWRVLPSDLKAQP